MKTDDGKTENSVVLKLLITTSTSTPTLPPLIFSSFSCISVGES